MQSFSPAERGQEYRACLIIAEMADGVRFLRQAKYAATPEIRVQPSDYITACFSHQDPRGTNAGLTHFAVRLHKNRLVNLYAMPFVLIQSNLCLTFDCNFWGNSEELTGKKQ